MVRKLCKYEWLSFARSMLPLEGILLGLAILCRGVQFFEADSVSYGIIKVSSIVALCIAMVVAMVMVVVIAVSRFYKNLYTSEGYLTFALPATPTQLLFSKWIVAMLFFLLTIISVLLAGAIAMAGDVLWEVLRAAGYLITKFTDFCGVNGVFYLIEAAVALILLMSQAYLLFCTCISVGQLSKKNRILMAFLAYFGYYIITQIVGTVLVIIFTLNAEAISEWVVDFLDKSPYLFFHLSLCLGILITLLLNALYAFLTRWLMKNKLNLE